jgi:hypothetical protein
LDSESQKIIQWISPLAYRARHLDVLDKAEPGTRIWLLESCAFKRWANGETKVLWCAGIRTFTVSRCVEQCLQELTCYLVKPEPAKPYRREFLPERSSIYPCSCNRRSSSTSRALSPPLPPPLPLPLPLPSSRWRRKRLKTSSVSPPGARQHLRGPRQRLEWGGVLVLLLPFQYSFHETMTLTRRIGHS